MKIKLVESTPDDAEILICMINKLAEIDGVGSVPVGKEQLFANIYSDSPVAFAKLIIYDEKVAGFIIHSWKFATFLGTRDMYMQATYIEPEFRRRGVATKVLGKLAKLALDSGCSRMEWYAIEGNNMSGGFYDALGACTLSDARVRRFSTEVLVKLSEID
ncbi:GNAT family N-acetyltransferase [Aliikangiella sp. G2MR2-5]|uniref:GNAT family N-acetyltransferase n=1 Tax=Aliikangiella sp. G2MR2-5 TaxID=2788943 RepID=UPI0018AB5FA8|nr:GNAT family N-acetyltransferase [Aliikangiella sp. G2MR2-5]